MKDYCSILGFKIALTVAIFITLPIVGHLVLHEYAESGAASFYDLASDPSILGIAVLSFLSIMYALSKLVILPLKRLEMHITEVEEGKKKEPFQINRADEIGSLAKRLNSLQSVVLSEIQEKETQLSVLYNFTNATSGTFDVLTLMESFFRILHSSVEFEAGAFTLVHNEHVSGKIYSAYDVLSESEAEELTSELCARAAALSKDFPGGEQPRFDSLKIEYKRPVLSSFNRNMARFIDLPIISFGQPIGVISLISCAPSFGSADSDRVFAAMVRHANTVIERLLLHISEEDKKLASILSSMSEGVYLIDKDGHARYINKQGLELVASYCNHPMDCAKRGFAPCLTSCPAAPVGECEFSNVVNKVRNNPWQFDGKTHVEEIRSRDGIVLQLSISNLMTESQEDGGYVITAKDVTEDRLIQKRIMLSSKLAALGEMAAGIAHEVNNPLQVMMANLELLESNVSEKGVRRVESLKDGIMRIKTIVKDLLIFAREQTTEVEDVDINAVIDKVVSIMQNQLKLANISLELELDRRALYVRCNHNLFQQVIINLVQNAKDAIEEHRRGTKVYIRTVLLPGGIVVAEVADDGPGIPENIIDKVFDPFFTTKDVGKGTGLGLSVSRRIVESMGGNITVSSSPRLGTTFSITLLHNRTTRKKEDRQPGPEKDYTKLSGKSVILVDDEDGMLRAIKESIGPKVAEVESFSEGGAALERIMDKDFDLVLLDIKMPGINGMEIFRHISQHKPYLAEKVLFMTGDIENESTESFIKLTGCRYLTKPFTMKELLNVMCEYEMELSA